MDFFGLLYDNSSLPVLGDVMAFSEMRQNVLANDVANINVPGFRQTDLPVSEFTAALDSAIQRRDENSPHRFEVQSTRNIQFGPQLTAAAQDISNFMNYYDGADRSLEALQNEILKNAVWHETAARLLAQQGQLLMSAIKEQA